jgi:hypothetical protein
LGEEEEELRMEDLVSGVWNYKFAFLRIIGSERADELDLNYKEGYCLEDIVLSKQSLKLDHFYLYSITNRKI